MSVFRVSEVESYRQWRDDDEAELDVLLARLRGLGGESEAMRAGTAFHKALETAPTGIEVESMEALDHKFTFDGDFEIGLPTIREVRASKRYRVGDGWLTVSGQLDCLFGKRVDDHKTTGRFDPDRYLTGYQWRLYLDIFGADIFRWNVFEIKQDSEDPMHWAVLAAHRLEQFRYPAMASDCQGLVEDFARFARVHLPERFERVAA